MKTVLDVVQTFCYRANLPAPSSIANTTDPAILQLKHLLCGAAETIRASKCWPQQKRTHTFQTVASQAGYQLPADFYSVLPITEYDDSTKLTLRGLSDIEAAYILYGIGNSGINLKYRLFGFDANSNSEGGQFKIVPVPSSVVTIKFEYLFKSLFIPKNWTASASFSAGTYCNASGNIYVTSAGGTTGATVPSHTSGSVSDGGVTWTYTDSPYETILADTDLCLFDDDLMVLGLKAGFHEENGGAFDTARADLNKRLETAIGRMTPAIHGTFASGSSGPRYTAPSGNWGI